jgi:Meiotically Up-regulated Gene 113 (MUG113) protein
MKLQRRDDRSFPNEKVFRRYGNKAQIAAALIEYCGDDPALVDIVAIAEPVASAPYEAVLDPVDSPVAGEVYLMKSGAHYKIGRSNSAGRRSYELAIQLPQRLEVLHVIETDDAVGIERYWHQRFADRRTNGEWFALTKADIAAFRRRKRFM